MAEVPHLTERSQPKCSWWVLHSIMWICQFYLSAWVIWNKCWALLDILIYASTTQKDICSFELFLLRCFPTLIYQLIVRTSCAFVFIDVYYSCGPSSHSIPEWLGETNSRTNPHPGLGQSSCNPQIKMPIQLLFCSTLKYCHFYIKNVMRIAPPLMNSWRSDTYRHHYSFFSSVLL